MTRIRLHRLAARAGDRSGGARAERRCGGARDGRRDARPDPRHDRRRRPLSARRPARGRGLEAGRGEPVRPRRQGRPADRRAARLSRSATADWDGAFADGLATALARLRPAAARRRHGGDAGGRAARARPDRDRRGRRAPVPSRGGARPGDHLWVSGTIGDAGAGLQAARRRRDRAGRPGRALPQPAAAARGRRSGSRRSCRR